MLVADAEDLLALRRLHLAVGPGHLHQGEQGQHPMTPLVDAQVAELVDQILIGHAPSESAASGRHPPRAAATMSGMSTVSTPSTPASAAVWAKVS